MEAVTEDAVVGEVGGGSTHANHGNPVHGEHNQREDGKTQPAVGDNLINLVGGGEAASLLFLVAGLDHLGDVNIALIGDDGFGIVIQFGFRCLDVLFNVVAGGGGDIQLSQHLVVPLKDLDGIPSLLLLGHIVQHSLLNVGNGVLHRTGEGVHGDGFNVLGGINGGFCGFHDTGALQCGDFHDLAAQLLCQLVGVNLIAVFPHNIHHVHGDDHGDAQLGQLSGQVQVALQIGAVDDVQDGIGTLANQIISGDDFLQGVGGQGIDAGQVGDDNTIVLFQLALFLFHGNTGPVANELIGAGQGVEQGGFTAVRVARKGDS